MTDDLGEGLAATLIQISAHAERIAGLDAREAAHYGEIVTVLGRLGQQVAAVADRTDGGIDPSRQAEILTALDELETQVTELSRHLAQVAEAAESSGDGPNRYRPVPVPRWWKLEGAERDAAIGRLRAWVEHIYRPGYGRLAAMLPPCWDQHPICLYTLDWLSELWSVLYVSAARDDRDVAAQGEWQTRLLTAAAEQMAHGTAGCQHAPPGVPRPRHDPGSGLAHRPSHLPH